MKKITLIIITALMAVCNAVGGTPFDCNIELTSLQAYKATVSFTPADDSEYYICSVALKTTYENLGETYIQDYFHETMYNSISEGSAATYTEFAHQGQYEYTNEKLTPETEYVAFAYSMNPNTGRATSGMKVVSFTTPKELISTEDVELHIVSPHWIDKTSTAGFWQITGWTEDYGHYVQFCADPATRTTGTFTYTNTSWDWDYTGVYYYPGEGTFPTKRVATDMTVEITIENDQLIARADYLDDRGVTYHITFDPVSVGTSGEQGQTYDMSFNVEATFTPAEGHADYDAGESCHTLWYQNGRNEYLEVKLYTAGDTLEDGEYTINDTNQNFTAESASFESDSGRIYGSVYGELTDEGYMSTPWFWFMAGTVVVSHDAEGNPQLAVNATNTWGKTCKVTVKSAESDAIRDVTAEGKQMTAKKYTHNGQIIIEKNGQKFNAIGALYK